MFFSDAVDAAHRFSRIAVSVAAELNDSELAGRLVKGADALQTRLNRAIVCGYSVEQEYETVDMLDQFAIELEQSSNAITRSLIVALNRVSITAGRDGFIARQMAQLEAANEETA